MFEGLISLFQSRAEKKEGAEAGEGMPISLSKKLSKLGCTLEELAHVVILVDVAMVDNDFDRDEQHWIRSWLSKHYRLSKECTSELLSEARKIVSSNSNIEAYAKYLHDHLHYHDRSAIVSLIERLMEVDRRVGPFEKKLRQVYGEMLGVYVEEGKQD